MFSPSSLCGDLDLYGSSPVQDTTEPVLALDSRQHRCPALTLWRHLPHLHPPPSTPHPHPNPYPRTSSTHSPTHPASWLDLSKRRAGGLPTEVDPHCIKCSSITFVIVSAVMAPSMCFLFWLMASHDMWPYCMLKLCFCTWAITLLHVCVFLPSSCTVTVVVLASICLKVFLWGQGESTDHYRSLVTFWEKVIQYWNDYYQPQVFTFCSSIIYLCLIFSGFPWR